MNYSCPIERQYCDHIIFVLRPNMFEYINCYLFYFLVSICEIKEIRSGKISKDFDRLQDEARKFDSQACFSIFYGNEFNLKVLSIAGWLLPSQYHFFTVDALVNN